MRFVIFQINRDFLIIQPTKYFYTRNLTPVLYFKKNCALHVRIFEKYPLFTTFLLVLIVNEVCNITNKKQPPSNLGKYQYFYTRDLISSTHFERKLALSIANAFLKHPLFTTFSLFLKGSEVCNISNKS